MYAAGVVHGAGAAASSEHVTDVEFVVANEKLADVVEVVEAGCETMVTVGGGVTVHEYDALVESEPEAAVTVNTCAPGARPVKLAGAEHGAGAPVSIEQLSDVAFAATNENAAEVDEVVEAGPERMFTVGGGVTVHG